MDQKVLQLKLKESFKKFRDHCAIDSGSRTVTYGELDRITGTIADLLWQRGVEREMFIGVLVEERIDLIFAIIGILKAGCVFVPLDTGYPEERLGVMIDATDMELIICDRENFGHFKTNKLIKKKKVELVLLEERKGEIEAGKQGTYSPNDRVYIYYTSGTTGIPRAIVGKNVSLLHFIEWEIRTFGIDETFCFSQFTNPGFDVFLRDIFVPLCAGGTICIPAEKGISMGAESLIEWIDKKRVNLIHCVPSLFRLLNSDGLKSEHFKSLKYVLLAGERVVPQELSRWYETFGVRIQLINLYGPTETTLAKMFYPIQISDTDREIMPVGKHIDGARAIILKENLQPPGRLVAGEIYIRTPYRSFGYLNDPELNARRFIPNPFNDDPADLLYKTGDYGMLLPDGNIELLGRLDRQVKIQGIRVELDEIENAIVRHPSVRESVVVKREITTKNEFLFAFITRNRQSGDPGEDDRSLISGLREYLQEKLPAHMIPADIHIIEQLPRKANGKVDYDQIAKMIKDYKLEYIAPGSEIEGKLSEIWSEILGFKQIGVTKSFFELGGNSLGVMTLIARIQREFGITITLRDVFENITIKLQAEFIESARRASADKYISIKAVEEKEYYPLTSVQKRLYFLQQVALEAVGYNLPQVAMVEGDLSRERLDRVFGKLIQRHEGFRTSFRSIGGEPTQRIHREIDFTVEYFAGGDNRSSGSGDSRQLAPEPTAKDFIRPFDLACAPLLRLRLIKIEEQKFILMSDMHHIIADGISREILMRDFVSLHEGEELPPLRLQYKDYAEWQNSERERENIKRQERYWLESFSGQLPVLDLPLDFPRPPAQSFAGSILAFEIGSRDSQALKTWAEQQGATLYMVLSAVYNIYLAKLCGQADIIMGTTSPGREHAGMEQVIGMFVNTLVLRNHVDGSGTFTEFLEEVKGKILGAFENRDYPFEELVEKLTVQRDMGRNPLFDVMWVWQNMEIAEVDIAGLKLKPCTYEENTAKFDLTLQGMEVEEHLLFKLEYSTRLFKKETAARFAEYFKEVTASVVEDPGRKIADIEIIPAKEKRQILADFNDTTAEFPGRQTVDALFERQVESTPDRMAVGFEAEQLTYGKLDEKCSQLARFLVTRGIGANEFVAVIMERSPEMVMAVLGILKSGAAYVPLEPGFPDVRIKGILKNVGARCLMGSSSLYGRIAKIQWELPELEHVLLLDVETPKPPVESIDRAAVISLWDHVAERATDRVTAGGFVSAYTGEPFSEAEVDEYVEHVARLAQPYIGPDKQVLEIGCGSGLIMFRLAPSVARYVGLDPSALTQQRNRQYAADHNCTGIDILEGFAHQLDTIESIKNLSFDLIILASTVQFFPGFGYLERVIELCLDLLNPGGTLLIADIMDLRQKEDFKKSIADYQRRYSPDKRVKIDLESELHVPREFFKDLGAECDQIGDIEILPRHQGFENELKFRYDVTLHKREAGQAGVQPSPPLRRRKSVWTGWHLHGLATDHVKTPTTADDAAYIIFTSGSTGIPKGVLVRHKPVINLFDWVNRSFGVGRDDRLLFVTSLCFDLSVYDIFGILIAGGVVRVASDVDRHDPRRLVDILRREPITFWDSAPALLQQLVPYLSAGDSGPVNTGLRLVFLSGDWIPVTLPDILKSPFPNVRVIGLGGATEATVWSNYFPIDRVDSSWVSIPYGKPIQNAKYFILDANLTPCAIGVAGDLYIGGECLCTGYVNEPELTARSLLPDPFGKDGKRSIYRTGDNARWLPDGNMEFLGRKDSQVKIRGFRIELGEIESLLLNHEAVKEAVAVAREEEGDKYLCAYIVSDIELRGIELREYLLDKLPTYMVPAYFVRLEKLPLTAGGKVDRRSLPQPGETAMASGIDYAAPASVIEKTLAEIWKGVLARETIGVNDNFFMIGGDSIKSLQIASRMNEAGYRLEIKDLFRYPSISALAPRVTVAERTADQSVVTGTIPLTPIQSEFFQRSKTAPHHYNQAVMFFSAAGFDEEAVKTVLMKIQEHHDALRMSYEEVDGEIIQTNHGLDYPFSLPAYDLRGREDVGQVLEARINEIQAGINLQNGPLLKPALFHLDDGDRLLMVAHHLVIDGLSWRILFEDIEHLYRQYQRGETFSLPPKTDSFKTWAEALTAYADKEAVLREKPYWARLESASVPVIPRDFERGTNYRKDAERLSFSLDEEKTSHLLMDVNRAFATEINDILLTALGLGIRQTFGHEKVLLTVEGHGRQEISKELDVSRTVGWFTTVYPLLLEVSHADDLARQIKEIKESLRQVPNKGIGYGILKYLTSAVHIEEMDFSSNPQIGFNYLGQFDVDLEQISFRVAEESVGTIQSPGGRREFELEVAGLIADNRLVMSVTFNKNQFKRETVEVLLNRFQTELCRIISYCLSREKRELTPSDLTYRGLSIAVLDRLAAQYPIEDIYTLSPMQEGMLFHALYDPSSTAYFMQISYRLHVHGRLEVSRVKESLNVLMARYQVLRTAFIYEGLDRPLQVVLNEHQIDFYYEDIREATTEKREAFIGEFKDRDRRVGFDLGKGRLMRVALIRLGDVEYEFIWSFHHILMDGWCTGILISEFFRIYHTLLENRPVRLPPARAYKTYIEWLEQQNREESRNYWLNYLDGYDRAAGISNINRVKAPGKGYKNEQIVMAVTEKVTADLNKLARRNHVTLNTTLQTAWGILLGKYNGSRDVVFGAAVSGRPAEVEGVESMVGLFTNTIPVRIRYEDGDTRENRFNELLREVQQAAVDSEPHHYYPLAEIQSRSILKQDLIDHILVFESFPTAQQIDVHDDTGEEEQVGAAVELLAMELHSQTNYDFNLILVPGERLTLRFMYNAGVYEREFVDRTLRHFLRIIEQVLLDEAIPVTELTLLTAEEKSESIKMVKDQRGQSSTEDAKTESDRFDNREANFNF